MKQGFGLALLIHGAPMLWGLMAYLLIFWHGRVLEGVFMAASWLLMAFAAYKWWKRVKTWPQK